MMIKPLLTALPLVAPLAAAQTAAPDQSLPPAIERAVSGLENYSFAQSWPLDVNRDGRMDRLVQASFAFPGGNAFYVENFIFYATGSGRSKVPVDIPRLNVSQVDIVPDGARITHIVLRDGDARCCPTGRQISGLSV